MYKEISFFCGRPDGRTGGRADGRTDGHTDGWVAKMAMLGLKT